MARVRAGKLRHIWSATQLTMTLKMRLYISACCSILTYGSEAWCLDERTCKALRGANSQMLSIITGKTPHQEASAKWRTFDLVAWIRARRLQWVGHILRMGPERMVKQAVFELFKAPTEGNLLMDVPAVESWRELCIRAQNKEAWRERVRCLRQAPKIRVDIGTHRVESTEFSFTISN